MEIEMEAENKLPSHFDSIDNLFEAHNKIRTRMISARCQDIEKERTIVNIILRRFREDPKYQTMMMKWI